MHVLIVKTTSLGDIIHALPAIEDATRALPGITFDWVAEAPFAELPRFHPAVREVITVRIRHWRKNMFDVQTWREIWQAFKKIRAKQYDKVIDAQGLIKSAVITRLAQGNKIGFSKRCAREPFSAYFYDETKDVNPTDHAIVRMRSLFAKALGYDIDVNQIAYGLSAVEKMAGPKPTLVLLHGTTWPTKHWPEIHWIALAQLAHAQGYEVLVSWGNETERLRAEKIAQDGNASVLPKMSLAAFAVVLKSASGVVSGDTGLGHLAAALDVPCLSLYGPSDPERTGACGKYVAYMASKRSCVPCFSQTCLISDMTSPTDPPCLGDLMPVQVLKQLNLLVAEPAQ
jgi:heptosyltransferase-1